MQTDFADTTVVFVSHDRSFLNACAQEVLLLRSRSLTPFVGNYDAMLQQLEEKAAFAERMSDALERKRGAMQVGTALPVRDTGRE